MGWFSVLFVFAICGSCCTGSFFDPSWNTLRVTWGMRVWQHQIFAKMPLTKDAAKDKGFKKVPEYSSCDSGFFRGKRYYKDSNSAVVLIYDKNGYFAGIQTGIPKSLVVNETLQKWYAQSSLFQEDKIGGEDMYLLTAYLVDPSTICTTGRSEDEYKESKSGTNLTIQSGPNPETDLMRVPILQEDLAETAWTRGKCFPSMGVHYWYNTSQEMNCDNFLPVFLLYNHGKLTGFGWATLGLFDFSNRYEHPPKSSFARFMDPVPDCLNSMFDEVGGFTTQHIYMNSRPWNLFC